MAHNLEQSNKHKFSSDTMSISRNSLGSTLPNYTIVSSVLQVKQSSEFEEPSFLERKSLALDSIDFEDSDKLLDKSYSTERSSYDSIKVISPILTYKEEYLNISTFYLD